MRKREIARLVRGQRAIDGAGVRLIRVIGNRDVKDFDPFLMLDSFDSSDPDDYTAGFPWHPHRGIETVTYLVSGRIDHEDSLGNKGTIHAGESQWMTAGSGILHQEMPQPSDRMLGLQLWLNLPRNEKMAEPAYLSITKADMAHTVRGKADILVLAGGLEGAKGVAPRPIPATMYDVRLPGGEETEIAAKPEETVFVFLLQGNAVINGQSVLEKTAVLFSAGDYIAIAAQPDTELRFLFFSGKPLREPVAWGGPIVMNTREELELAFAQLDNGTFIRHARA